MSVIVMTVIGDGRRDSPDGWEKLLPAPAGCCWRFVPEGSLAVQVRAILRIEPSAVVVWVGSGAEIDQAEQLVRRLLMVGMRVVIVVVEEHDEAAESVLRQAGAVYLCGEEAERGLGEVLECMLGPPARASPEEEGDSADVVKLDGS